MGNLKSRYFVCPLPQTLPRAEVVAFVKKWHYSGTLPGSAQLFVLFHRKAEGDVLVGVMSFSPPATRNQAAQIDKDNPSAVWELRRLCCIDDTPKNTESFFIGRALRWIRRFRPDIRYILSLADSLEGHTGVIYRASNFIFIGMTSSGQGTYLVNGIKRHARHIYKDIPKKDRNLEGLRRHLGEVVYVPRSKKYKYLYTLKEGDK